MVDGTWWAFRLVEVVTLVACVSLAALASRRVGPSTPYGAFLFVQSLGFALLLCGVLLTAGSRAATGSSPPGDLYDVASLGGWCVLGGSFFQFAVRFRRSGADVGGGRPVAAYAAAGALAAFAVFATLAGVPSVAGTPTDRARFLFFLVDGSVLGIVFASVGGLMRLRQDALGRLYIVLALGLAAKTAGDLLWLLVAYHGLGSPVVASGMYPLAGVLAFLALLLHHRLVAGARAASYGDPSLPTEARVLRDVARGLAGLAGEAGIRTAHASVERAFASNGIRVNEPGAVYDTVAPPHVWRAALAVLRDDAVARFGDGAEAPLRAVAAAYGEEYAFLRGGGS